jgi:hypothetical protein
MTFDVDGDLRRQRNICYKHGMNMDVRSPV